MGVRIPPDEPRLANVESAWQPTTVFTVQQSIASVVVDVKDPQRARGRTKEYNGEREPRRHIGLCLRDTGSITGLYCSRLSYRYQVQAGDRSGSNGRSECEEASSSANIGRKKDQHRVPLRTNASRYGDEDQVDKEGTTNSPRSANVHVVCWRTRPYVNQRRPAPRAGQERRGRRPTTSVCGFRTNRTPST